MPVLWKVTTLVIALVGFAQVAAAQTSRAQEEQRHKQLMAEHNRRVAEMKRKMRQPSNSHRAAAGLTPLEPSTRPPAWNPPRKSPARLPNLTASRQPPQFFPSQAPPPADCLWKYVAVARSASSMEQILPYMPASEARALQEEQATYDPKQAVQSRISLKKLNPQITEDGLTYLTNAPYVNALDRHRSIAKKILEVLSVKVEGDKATLEVSTTNGAIVDGMEYPYGTASIELHGEDNTWKVGAYNDGNIAYLYPPKPNAPTGGRGTARLPGD